MTRRLAITLTTILLCLWPTIAFATLTDNNNGTITDSSTGLMWTKNIDCGLNWNDATSTAAALTFATYTDWALPTRADLLALIDPLYAPQLNPIFDPGINPGRWSYWSSTVIQVSHAIDEYQVYVVFYGDGTYFTSPKLSQFCARYRRSTGAACEVTISGANVTFSGVCVTW